MSSKKSNGKKHFLCDDHDIWADEVQFFEVGPEKVMIWRDVEETIHAYSATCPHQDRDLEETGKRECVCGPHDDSKTMTCTAHSWEFDLESGDGLNPTGPELNEYEAGVEDGEIFVVLTEAN